MKFDKVITEQQQVVINTSAASEHVAKIEHKIRVIKERCCTNIGIMPFKNSPKLWQLT